MKKRKISTMGQMKRARDGKSNLLTPSTTNSSSLSDSKMFVNRKGGKISTREMSFIPSKPTRRKANNINGKKGLGKKIRNLSK